MQEPLSFPGNYCVMHGYHWPKPLRTVIHHIWPREFGGPDIKSNTIQTCDNGHYNVHAILDALLKNKPPPKGTRKENAVARAGYDAVMLARAADSGQRQQDSTEED